VPSLLLTDGPLAGRRLSLELQDTFVLGRADVDIAIDDPQISRRHAVIRSRPPILEVEDLGSLNGTWVNGERITGARALHPGDVVRLGATAAQVEHDAEGERATVAAAPPVDVRGLRFAPPGSGSPGNDELRPVTALFADLEDSTRLGEELAPHEVKAVIGGCVTRMSGAIERFGGSIQAYMGDGVAAFFGVPIAHEDDPERAARAALAILGVVDEYALEIGETMVGVPSLGVRVGINTGEVAVGLVGAAEPQAVSVGDTTNVAARLEAAAEPGTIVVGEATARAIARRFALEPLGELRLRGRNRPVAAWRLLGALEAARAWPSLPLIDRKPELERLRGVLDDLSAGRGQVVLLVGESGIGKSRLLAEFRTLVSDRATWLEGHCLSYGAELIYGPFVEALRNWGGIADGERSLPALTQMRARLGLVPGLDAAVASSLARLLGIQPEPDAPSPERAVDPALDDRMEVRRAYRAWLGGLAERGPVVLALKDLHWADVATCELAGELLRLTDLSPLVVVGTLRRDPGTEGWRLRGRIQAEYSHRAVEMTLASLDPEQSLALLKTLPAAGRVDAEALNQIVAEAEGNPLYLEELLNATASGRRKPRRRTWVATVSMPTLPPALESVLLAHIDRLPGEARHLAQTAAVVGRRFPLRVLEQLEGSDLSEEIAALLRADVIREVAPPPEAEFAFRHGLLRETVLATLPPARRRCLHGAVGAAFETLWGPVVDDRLEVLAHYFSISDDLEKGLRYLELAAERAADLDAPVHAAELSRRAFLVADRLGDVEAQERLRSRLQS
jgi:class 3 adenylate cyclase/energy-coupling factor transporter ATP-binding protein EcfA2